MTYTEINEAVARKLGWKPDTCKCWPGHTVHCEIAPKDYCHSIAAAWEVWDKMSMKYFLTLETEAGEFGRNIVKVWKNDGKDCGWVIEDIYANTAPLAICLAFFKLP